MRIETAAVTETANNVPSEFRMEHRDEEPDDVSRREGASSKRNNADEIVEAVRKNPEGTKATSPIGS